MGLVQFVISYVMVVNEWQTESLQSMVDVEEIVTHCPSVHCPASGITDEGTLWPKRLVLGFCLCCHRV